MPSPLATLSWIDKARSLVSGADSIQRISRLYDKQPLIARSYSPEAVSRAIEYSQPKQVALLHPGEFKALAFPLDSKMAAPYVKHYKDLLKQQKWVEPDEGLFMDHYLDRMREKPFEGFSDVPFLQYKQDPTSELRGQVYGHEGRHRMITLDQLYPGEKFPVRFQGDLPNRPRFVYPEAPGGVSIDLSGSDRYASGGQITGALSMLKKAVHQSKDYLKIRDALAPLVAPKQKISDDARIMINELMHNSEADPHSVTTILNDGKAAYQLSPRENGTYLPYIYSTERGLGTSALEDAYQSAPKKPVSLFATPESVGFYRKQPGWVESSEDGISKFTRK